MYNIGEKECLQDTDQFKYKAVIKFNPKRFKSGPSVGYISVMDSTFELFFAQVKMSMEQMFDVLPMTRFNHIVGNSGSKVCFRWTAQSVVL